MRLILGDDWTGAWDEVPWHRPDDWRAVAGQLHWDTVRLGAGWHHLEAAHQKPDEQRSLLRRMDALCEVLAADLPYLLGVGPSAPEPDQAQLPIEIPDEPPLESLAERPGELSWRLYFWMVLEQTLDHALERAAPVLRQLALADRGAPRPHADVAFDDALAATFPASTTSVEVDRWWHRRAAADLSLGRSVAEQVALQVELLLREQLPTVLPLLEESIALQVDDAALGGAVHVETHRDRPVALRLVSYEGRARGPIWLDAEPDADLAGLLAAAGRAAPVTERVRA